MKRILIILSVTMAATLSCKKASVAPRSTIPLVLSIADDSTSLRRIAAEAGSVGAPGSIAIAGEPAEAILLARRFAGSDIMDNVSGMQKRDSLPDFAGETFETVLDALNSPFAHFLGETSSTDSLREAAVTSALFAWDSTCYRLPTDGRPLLTKNRAKILIFTSSLQSVYGLFDVDTLQQLTGGKCHLLSPAEVLLEETAGRGARSVAVWTTPSVKESGVWEKVFAEKAPSGSSVRVLVPLDALDARTQFRDILRQYRSEGLPLDALIIDNYSVSSQPLEGELRQIRRSGTEEDASFDRFLSDDFAIISVSDALIRRTYSLLREKNLFSHRISRPKVKYYESNESDRGETVFVEAASSYVHDAYVSNLD